MVVSC